MKTSLNILTDVIARAPQMAPFNLNHAIKKRCAEIFGRATQWDESEKGVAYSYSSDSATNWHVELNIDWLTTHPTNSLRVAIHEWADPNPEDSCTYINSRETFIKDADTQQAVNEAVDRVFTSLLTDAMEKCKSKQIKAVYIKLLKKVKADGT